MSSARVAVTLCCGAVRVARGACLGVTLALHRLPVVVVRGLSRSGAARKLAVIQRACAKDPFRCAAAACW